MENKSKGQGFRLKDNPELCDRLEAAIRGQTEGLAGEMMTGPDGDDDI